jgi:hypothetical protein
MSDLQLLAGLAIMISGFAQLRSGLSTYHWERVVNTAWFVCITHLCCLTFLRDHLLRNRVTQMWRVPGMVVLTTMVIYGLVTTSRFASGAGYWSNPNTVEASQPAICYFNPSSEDWADIDVRSIISIVFLGFGMINRIRRLYRAPNLIIAKVRKGISHRSRHFLMYVYGKGSADSLVACLAAVLIYRPLLALFLMIRLLMDGLTSMAFEVRKILPHKIKKLANSGGMLGYHGLRLGQREFMGGPGINRV